MSNLYFWGVIEGEETEDIVEHWKALHAHFEKLTRDNDDAEIQATERKAVDKHG